MLSVDDMGIPVGATTHYAVLPESPAVGRIGLRPAAMNARGGCTNGEAAAF
jgi:hypothetical protein